METGYALPKASRSGMILLGLLCLLPMTVLAQQVQYEQLGSGQRLLLSTNQVGLRTTSLSVATSPLDSLPQGMPWNTRLLWGQHGLFRLIGLAPASRRRELEIRQTMLQWHQRMALVTFAALTTQVILGEVLASNRPRYYQELQPVHRTLGYVTFGLYMGTASLSLGAPPARRYDPGFSSIKLHRWLALIHFSGMALQPWLGRHVRAAPSAESYDRRLNTHRWVGRLTLGAYTAAFLVITLPY